jgi:hypothetical protein
MTGSLIYGFTSGNFLAESSKLMAMPRGIISLVDLYVGFSLFSCWIVLREKTVLAAGTKGSFNDGIGILDRCALYLSGTTEK